MSVMQEAIARAMAKQDLGRELAAAAMREVMDGKATQAQIGAWLTALRMKGESVDEITGCAQVMREKATAIRTRNRRLVDTCGTGGDGSNTFNISTTAAFVVAGCGLAVAKHGNRAASSRCGSADVLEALGVRIDLEPEHVAACVDEVGIGFLFAPALHGAMKNAGGPRRELGVRTIFNLLGPLTNPAGAGAQVVGVPEPELTEPIARVLGNLGSEQAFVVHGLDGLDEISICAESRLSHLRGGQVRTYSFSPEEVGLARATRDAITGGDAATNAGHTREVLAGRQGARRDVVVLNAAAALVAGGAANDFAEGVRLAAESIDSGAAAQKLETLCRYSQRASA